MMKKLFLVVNVDKFFLSHRKEIALAAKEAGYEVTIVNHFTGREGEISSIGLRLINLLNSKYGANPYKDV